MKNNKKMSLAFIVLSILLISSSAFLLSRTSEEKQDVINVDLSSLKINEESIKTYEQSDFTLFTKDFNDGTLDPVYITKFIYDGVSMYKSFDLDDFIENGNDTTINPVEITVININTSDVELTGSIKGAMIAVNTNNLKSDVNISLNNVNIDTDSKKVPVMYVYNKDMNYTEHKVTIIPVKDSKNYLEGGKFKKVSLTPSDDLSSYTDYYNGENKENYLEYTNYYGVYNSEQIDNILFAKVKTDNEGLQDGDPYYYYKASGAISSDIDLYFNGEGYLKVSSKNKEGIETKGNLTFEGGTGDYEVFAFDDCLNTTSSKNQGDNVRNTLSIDVKSLTAIVSVESDEGDAIDSNGELIINGGNIIALAKNGADAGLDSENGTSINGGTILATGDMFDEIKSSSKQRFVVFEFGESIQNDELITFMNDENIKFSYKTDRPYKYLIYSSNSLEEKTYSLYKDGEATGDFKYGFYQNPSSYTKGEVLAYTTTGSIQGGFNHINFEENTENNEFKEDLPEKRDDLPSNKDDNAPPFMDETERKEDFNPKDNNENQQFDANNRPPEFGEGGPNQDMQNSGATNKEFTLSGISNIFRGIAKYEE